MNILITGGMGVLGSMVVEELMERDSSVVLYARHQDHSLLPEDVIQRVRYVRGDVLDLPNLVHTLREYNINCIVHMAALLIGEAQQNPYLGFKINAEGTVNVLEAARIAGVSRFVYTSSKSIYGAVPPPYCHPTYTPLPEDGPKNPIRVYDVTKLAGEHMALNYVANFNLDVIILRFASTFGPGKILRHGPVSWHSRIIENAMSGKASNLPHGGDQQDDMIYHRDIAHAIVLSCYVDRPQHRVFNIGRGKATTMRHFAEAVQQIIPNANIQIGDGLDYYGSGIPYYSIYDISRAREELGFQPKFTLASGVQDYIDTMGRIGAEPTITV